MPTTVVSGAAAGDATRVFNSGGIRNFASVAFAAADGNTKEIRLGFKPRFVTIINETDNIVWSKGHLMSANGAVKEVAGGQTMDSGGHVLFVDRDNGSKGALVLSPTCVPAGKNVSVYAEGD